MIGWAKIWLLTQPHTAGWWLHTHGHLPLLCSLTTCEVAKFQAVKNKALSKRLIHKSIPTVKPLLMSNFSPHLVRASALVDGHKGRTLHQPIRFRTWLTLANLWRNIENAKIMRKFFWRWWEKDVLLCCVSQSSLKSMNSPQTTYRPHRGLNRPYRNSKIS